MYGENTYFEVLTKSLSSWKSGFILSGDDEESLENVKRSNLPQLYINLDPVTREFEDAQVPCFFTAGNSGYPVAGLLGFGIMEYHPSTYRNTTQGSSRYHVASVEMRCSHGMYPSRELLRVTDYLAMSVEYK